MKRILRAIAFYLFEDYIREEVNWRIRAEHDHWLLEQQREKQRDHDRQRMAAELEFFRKNAVDQRNLQIDQFIQTQEKRK